MELFVKNEQGDLEATQLIDVLSDALFPIKKFEAIKGSFSDESGSWVEIKKESETAEHSIVFSFDGEGDNITGIAVYKAPIRKVIVDDEQTKIF